MMFWELPLGRASCGRPSRAPEGSAQAGRYSPEELVLPRLDVEDHLRRLRDLGGVLVPTAQVTR